MIVLAIIAAIHLPPKHVEAWHPPRMPDPTPHVFLSVRCPVPRDTCWQMVGMRGRHRHR